MTVTSPKKPAQYQFTDEALIVIAERFRMLSEPTRLRLINALRDGEQHVNGLVQRTGLNQANVSRQLKVLTQAGILARRPSGVSVGYRIADPAILALCEQACDSLAEEFIRRGLRPRRLASKPRR